MRGGGGGSWVGGCESGKRLFGLGFGAAKESERGIDAAPRSVREGVATIGRSGRFRRSGGVGGHENYGGCKERILNGATGDLRDDVFKVGNSVSVVVFMPSTCLLCDCQYDCSGSSL